MMTTYHDYHGIDLMGIMTFNDNDDDLDDESMVTAMMMLNDADDGNELMTMSN